MYIVLMLACACIILYTIKKQLPIIILLAQIVSQTIRLRNAILQFLSGTQQRL